MRDKQTNRKTLERYRWDGKLNLVKNAFIEPCELEAMYAAPLQRLRSLKAELDSDFTFNTLFLKQKFPSYFGR